MICRSTVVAEVKKHGLKCRKNTERMRPTFEEHYVNFHGYKPVRGIQRKSYESQGTPVKKTQV